MSDNVAYVTLTDFEPGFSAYSADQEPKLTVSGSVVVLSGSVRNADAFNPGNNGVVMLTIPEGYRPPRYVRSVCQGSSLNRYLLMVGQDGSAFCARYGTTGNIEVQPNSWLVLDATWTIA